MKMTTIRRHDFFEVSSAFQKAIRRADARMAGYWALELYESGYHDYVWRRILVISAEDVWGIITYELVALQAAWKELKKTPSKDKNKGRIYIAKAVLLLCMAKKCRDADHLVGIVYQPKDPSQKQMTDAEIEASLDEARATPEAIPEYAHDVHTRQGKASGKTRADFLREEHAALAPRVPGLFDDLVK